MDLSKSIVVSFLVGTLGAAAIFLPFIQKWEEGLGLGLLFSVRGPREAPKTAVVVSIDRGTAQHIGVSEKIDDWPRSLHARLLANIAEKGATVIVFDLIFSRSRPGEEDRIFADAIRKAGNVLLCQSIKKERISLGRDGEGTAGYAHIEILAPLCAPLAEAAMAAAPFPLPKVPVRLNQFWKFKTGAGGAPTLPVVALQIHALDAYEAFHRLMEAVSPSHAALLPGGEGLQNGEDMGKLVQNIRSIIRGSPGLAESLRDEMDRSPFLKRHEEKKRLIASLIGMYEGEGSGYLNYYGPPGTITTVRYEDLLHYDEGSQHKDRVPSLKGKAVFVGFSELRRADQQDAFFTVFSRKDGVDISGVEIAATAFANLLDGSLVRQPSLAFLLGLMFFWGVVTATASALLSPLLGAVAALGLGALYLAVAVQQFSTSGTWSPLVVPLVLQLPTGYFGIFAWKYVITARERTAIHKAFSHYLPSDEIEQLAANLGDLSSNRLVYSTLLVTDVQGYTSLSEKMSSAELVSLMNRYYESLFPEVKKQNGSVSNIIGDAMLAIWAAAQPENTQREQACRAALNVARAVDRFNLSLGATQLPTRIGLHSGYLSLGNVGAGDHFEFTPMGDIVNTASRLEGLNKKLGTRILVSGEVVDGLEGFLTRELGSFAVAGKSREIVVHELTGLDEDEAEDSRLLDEAFSSALAAFRKSAWSEAIDGFRRCLQLRAEDGPARYFLEKTKEYQQTPPAEGWDGVVRLGEK